MFHEINQGNIEFKQKDNNWVAYQKIYKSTDANTKLYTTIIDDIGTATGSTLHKEIFGEKVFDYPKPVTFIERVITLIKIPTNSIILDSFVGETDDKAYHLC